MIYPVPPKNEATSYRMSSLSIENARLVSKNTVLLRHLTCVSDLKEIGHIWSNFSLLWDLPMSAEKTSYHLANVDSSVYQGLYLLSGKTSHRKTSWITAAARFGLRPFQSLWNVNRHLASSATEMPVKFQRDTTIVSYNLAASKCHEIWQWDVSLLSEYRPCLGSAWPAWGITPNKNHLYRGLSGYWDLSVDSFSNGYTNHDLIQLRLKCVI